jgi:hypothetical protein
LEYYLDLMFKEFGVIKYEMDKNAWREHYDIAVIAASLKQIIALEGIDPKQPKAIKMNVLHMVRTLACIKRRSKRIKDVWGRFMTNQLDQDMKYTCDFDRETKNHKSRKRFWQHRADIHRTVTKVAPALDTETSTKEVEE